MSIASYCIIFHVAPLYSLVFCRLPEYTWGATLSYNQSSPGFKCPHSQRKSLLQSRSNSQDYSGGVPCNLLWFLVTRPLPFHYYHRGHSLPEASRVLYTSDEETVLFRSNLLLVFSDLTSSEVIYLQLWFASQPHVGGVSFSPSAATSVAGELISYFPFLMLIVHSALGSRRS